MAHRVFTDLDLSGSVPARAQPRIGEWGPARVPSTRGKKWLRLWVCLALVVAGSGVFALGWWVFRVFSGI